MGTLYYILPEKYFIVGIDKKYRYIIIEKFVDNNSLTNKLVDKNSVISLSRCFLSDEKFENKEYLCDLKGNPQDDYRFNDFLVIKDNLAYYIGENGYLYKCELIPDAESEVIYDKSDDDNRFGVIAITSSGIYINKFHFVRTPVYDMIYDAYIYRLDLDGKNETQLNYSYELNYFVGVDGKLHYIRDNKIYNVE